LANPIYSFEIFLASLAHRTSRLFIFWAAIYIRSPTMVFGFVLTLILSGAKSALD